MRSGLVPDAGVRGGGLHCDGNLLLAGGIGKPPDPDLGWDMRMDLWAGRYQADGTPGWTFEQAFGPPYSFGTAGAIVGTAGGDVLVAGTYLDDDGSTYVPWLGRLTGG